MNPMVKPPTTILHQDVTSYTKDVANEIVYLDMKSIEALVSYIPLTGDMKG